MADDNGLKATNAAIDRAKQAALEAARKAVLKSAEEVAAGQRALVPVDSGDLKDSITVTPPGGTTPPHSQPGGSTQARNDDEKVEALITAGNAKVRYPHHVEHGTVKMEARPFFFMPYRLLKDRISRRNKRQIGKAVRDAFNGKSGAAE